MSDRITVHLDEATSDAELRSVAAEVAVAFGIAEEEARSLLEADVIILEGRQAEKLVAICRDLGVNGTLSKPPRRTFPRFSLPRYALPFSLGVLVTAFLVVMIALAPFSAQPSMGDSEPAEPISVPVVGSGSEEVATTEAPSVPTLEVSASGALTPEPTAPVISSLPVAEEATSTELIDEPVTEVPEIAEVPSLFTVARDGDLAQVREVLDGALEVDSRDPYGQTPLMYAAGANRAEVVTALLDAGANVQAQSDAGWTALMYAARNLAYPNVTAVLIDAGADLEALNADGRTAWEIAVANNNPEVAVQLEVEEEPRVEALEERETGQTAAQNRISVETATGGEAPLPISVSPRPARVVTVTPNPPARVITVSARPSPVPVAEVTGDAPRTGFVLSNAQIEDQRQLVNNCLQNWDTCGTD